MLRELLQQAAKTARTWTGSLLVRVGCRLLGLEELGEYGSWPLDDEDLDEDEPAVIPGVKLSDWAKQAVAEGARPTPPKAKTNGASTKPLTGSLADRMARARRASQE